MAQSPFEISKELRELAQKNIEQAQGAFRQFADAMSQVLGTWPKALPANEMISGFALVQDRAAHFAKQNAEAGFALANEIAKAKDVQEIFALQSRFAQSQMQSYATQTEELGRMITKAAEGAAQAIKPNA